VTEAKQRTPLEETTAAQQAAADPNLSAFVSANAGSGKTRVLTNRVARLLLAGVRAERILCITFTKAAAAEMSDRLFGLLGNWALMDDDILRKELNGLAPGIAADYTAEDFGRTRRLFAQALETPGGLKIQTIHSFCQSLLGRFPIEAGLAPGFKAIDEAEAFTLLNGAIDSAVTRASAAGDDPDADAVRHLANIYGIQLRDHLRTALISGAIRSKMSADNYETRLLDALGTGADTRPDDIGRATVDAINVARISQLREALYYGAKTALATAKTLAGFEDAHDWQERLKILREAFGKKDGGWRAKLVDAGTKKHDPQAETIAQTLRDNLCDMDERLRSATIYAEAASLARLIRLAARIYDDKKTARAALDFDDLIDRAGRLLSDSTQNAWVMYKLDQGIEHILLDEAQDTSPAAWDVIEAPLTELFAGVGVDRQTASTPTAGRTFFAVGDPKQSIYSFQGADSDLFQEKLLDLGKKFKSAELAYENFGLSLSFRTTAPVLSFVDTLFADRRVRDGVTDIDVDLRHGVFRTTAPGLVELWPLTPAVASEETEPWDAPLDAITEESRERRLAAAVAHKVADLLRTARVKDKDDGPDRPARPSDFMLLVQSRGPIFTETIRALSRQGVPTAGADKLLLLDDQAALDLMSYARAAVSTTDDLSLAELLKSPLFGADEELLYRIAHGRKGSLRHALKDACETGLAPADWYESFTQAAGIGRSRGPVAFFTHILDAGTPTGRSRLIGRIGAPSREPLEAFINQAIEFERSETPSLRGFIAWIMARGAVVKREADSGEDVVRVTTAHKAKGLEAPFVFLLDAQKRARVAPDHLILRANGGSDPAGSGPPVRSLAKKDAPASAETAKTDAEILTYNEYRRLMYVAMTRAKDRLYICGIEDKRSDPTDPARWSWHQHATGAFDRLDQNSAPGQSIKTAEAGELWELPVRRYGTVDLVDERPLTDDLSLTMPEPRDAGTAKTGSPDSSAYDDQASRAAAIAEPPAPEPPPLRLSPTRLADLVEEADLRENIDTKDVVFPPTGAEAALKRGKAIHRLLEVLPTIAPDRQEAAAHNLITRIAPDVSAPERASWTDEAMAVLNDPAFAAAFGPASRSEVAIAGDVQVDAASPDAPTLRVTGRVDRLVVLDDRVLVVDFKTNRPPPKDPADAPTAYLAQMGAYAALLAEAFPDKRIETALLWTYEPRLAALPPDLVAAAFRRAVRAAS
jgi:ATP-dependent helicase/nuclease subunit A